MLSETMPDRVTPQIVAALRGRFIVLDGSEGSGKSTQARMLGSKLQNIGLEPLLVRDPGTTRIGEQIRNILLDPAHEEMGMRCEMLLYMAARAQMMVQTILPALEAGKVVICDRFVSSTLAYQVGDGLTRDDIKTVGGIAIKHRWPDRILLLDMPVEQSMGRLRREKDRIEQRPAEYFEQVRRNYLAQAAAEPDRYRVIDASRSVNDVQADLWAAVLELGNERQNEEHGHV